MMGKKVSLDWLDAWIENELTQDELDALSDPKTICSLVGYIVYDDGTTIALAAEKVVGREGDTSWRAITFVPKCLITAGPTEIESA